MYWLRTSSISQYLDDGCIGGTLVVMPCNIAHGQVLAFHMKDVLDSYGQTMKRTDWLSCRRENVIELSRSN